MILPLGIFLALVWFLIFLFVACMDENEPLLAGIVGAIAILVAMYLIHHNWPDPFVEVMR